MLPGPNLKAAIFVVLHIGAHGRSALAAILSRADGRAHVPENHEAIRFGEVYVAPSDHHLIIEDCGQAKPPNTREHIQADARFVFSFCSVVSTEAKMLCVLAQKTKYFPGCFSAIAFIRS